MCKRPYSVARKKGWEELLLQCCGYARGPAFQGLEDGVEEQDTNRGEQQLVICYFTDDCACTAAPQPSAEQLSLRKGSCCENSTSSTSMPDSNITDLTDAPGTRTCDQGIQCVSKAEKAKRHPYTTQQHIWNMHLVQVVIEIVAEGTVHSEAVGSKATRSPRVELWLGRDLSYGVSHDEASEGRAGFRENWASVQGSDIR